MKYIYDIIHDPLFPHSFYMFYTGVMYIKSPVNGMFIFTYVLMFKTTQHTVFVLHKTFLYPIWIKSNVSFFFSLFYRNHPPENLSRNFFFILCHVSSVSYLPYYVFLQSTNSYLLLYSFRFRDFFSHRLRMTLFPPRRTHCRLLPTSLSHSGIVR